MDIGSVQAGQAQDQLNNFSSLRDLFLEGVSLVKLPAADKLTLRP